MRACIPYGWQEKDEPVILKDVEGKRINVIGVMNVRNELYYEQHEKNVNSEMIISFIDKFSEKIEKKTVLLMDQATIHTSDKIMEKIEEWKEKNLEIFWLPAYSPKLNLIENTFDGFYHLLLHTEDKLLSHFFLLHGNIYQYLQCVGTTQ
jgi:transposase